MSFEPSPSRPRHMFKACPSLKSLEYHPKKASLSQAGLSHLQTKNPATSRALRQVNFGDRNEDIRTYPLRAVCPVADIANNISGKSSNQQERDGSCTRWVRAERSRDPPPTSPLPGKLPQRLPEAGAVSFKDGYALPLRLRPARTGPCEATPSAWTPPQRLLRGCDRALQQSA